jgi:dTDP-4-dehydrorhamnose 3,5-epimerase
MQIKELSLKGILEITLSPFEDERGCFMRLYDQQMFRQFNIPENWVQENLSINTKKGILRGLHFILPPHTDGKLIRCSRGRIWDVVVDLRKDSNTLGRYLSVELCEEVFKWIYIPKGFAHGFYSLTDYSEITYKHDTFYEKSFDCGIHWADTELNIDWPEQHPLISKKDQNLMSFTDFKAAYGGL